MKKFLSTLLLSGLLAFSPLPALAQKGTPLFGQDKVGTCPDVSVWDKSTSVWVPQGCINTSSHQWTPAAGSVPYINVAKVGMVPGTADNSPFIQALMDAIITPSPGATGGGYEVWFPPSPGAASSTYYFSSPLRISRGGTYNCGNSTPRANATKLVFAAGVDGIVIDSAGTSLDGGTGGSADIIGCSVINLGRGTGTIATGSTTISSVSMPTYGSIPAATWSAGDGIMVMQSFNAGKAFTASISGAVLTVTAVTNPSTAPIEGGQSVFGTGVLPNTFVQPYGTGGTTGVGDVGTYALNLTYTAAQAVGSEAMTGRAINAQPNVLPGCYLDSADNTTHTLTLHAGCEPINTIFPTAAVLWQFPAALGVPVTTTSGSSTVTVASCPAGNPTFKFWPGDIVWSDAFPFGSTVFTVSGSACAQTLTFRNVFLTSTQNATVSHAAGSGTMWLANANVKRRVNSRTERVYAFGGVIGLQMSSSSGAVPTSNATISLDKDGASEGTYIGWLAAGNNTSATSTYGMVGIRNSFSDFADLGTLGIGHFGDNGNSGESRTAPYSAVGNCANQNQGSWFANYLGGDSVPFCASQSLGIAGPTTVAGQAPLLIAPQASIPVDMHVISAYGKISGVTTFQNTLPANLPCVNFSGGDPTKFYDIQYSKDCTTFNSLNMKYDSTTDAWKFFQNSAGQNFMLWPGPAYTGYKPLTTATSVTPVFPSGALLSPISAGGAAGAVGTERMLFYSTALPTGTWNKQGNIAFNTLPAAGGNVGWVDTADGANFYPFGLVSNNTAGTDFTIPILRSGSASNKDLTGRVTLTLGSATYNLAGTYATAPNCIAQDVTTPANLASVSESTTVLTFTGTGSDVVKYICMGRD